MNGTCSADGCNRTGTIRRGLCGKHYERLRTSEGFVSSKLEVSPLCSIEGCGRPHIARGWCNNHWKRWRRHGDPLGMFVPQTTCSVEGCGNVGKISLGMCNKHVIRWRKYGDVNHVEPRNTWGSGRRNMIPPPPRPFGADNPSWKGDGVGYLGAHRRTVRSRGKAAEQQCSHCDQPASEWAYDHSDANQLIDKRGRPYSPDPAHYLPLCVPCHRGWDSERIARRKAAQCTPSS